MAWGSSFHFNFPGRSVHHGIMHICDQNDGCSVLVNGDTDTLHAWWNVYYLTTLHDFFFGDAWKFVGKLLRDSSLYNKTQCITTITNHCFSHGVAFHLLEQLGSCKRSRPGGRWMWACHHLDGCLEPKGSIDAAVTVHLSQMKSNVGKYTIHWASGLGIRFSKSTI